MISTIIGWCVFGLVVGAIARLLMPGRDPMGWLATILLGVAGSVLGGLVASIFTGGIDRFTPASFIGSLIGAFALLYLLRRSGRRSTVERSYASSGVPPVREEPRRRVG